MTFGDDMVGDHTGGVDGRVLEPEQNEGYLGWQLPSSRDDQITDLVLASRRDDQLVSSLRPQQANSLGTYAERMASLARHEGSVIRIRAGLEAVVLAARLGDDRRGMEAMALLWHAASTLEEDPAAVFAEVAAHDPTHVVAAFAERDPQDRSLTAMGYVEVEPDPLFYARTW